MGIQRARPSHEILSGDSADVYFARAQRILEREGLDPVVTMEVFAREDAILCGGAWFDEVFRQLDTRVRAAWKTSDGVAIRAGFKARPERDH